MSVASLLLFMLGCSPSTDNTNASSTENASESHNIEAKKKWVQEVRDDDFFFWDRYFRRLARGGAEFPQPDAYYTPSKIIEGSEGAPLPRVALPNRTIPTEALEEISSWAFARKTGALIVMKNNQIEFEQYDENNHSGSLLAVRSFAKTLPAILIGIALEQGHVKSLEEPVSNYIDEWKGDKRGEITIRQFLTWSTGLEAVGMNMNPDNKILRLAEGSNIYEVALSYQQTSEPDTLWAVNQMDSQITALVIERATGQSYADYLSENFWQLMAAGTATLNLDGPDGDTRAFCCMRARAVDWLKIGSMLMNEGRWNGSQILPADYVAEMLKPSSTNPFFGLSVWRGWSDPAMPITTESGGFLMLPHTEPYKRDEVYYLLGGHSITMWMIPEEDLVILRWGDDPEDWDKSYIPNTILKHIEPRGDN